MFVWTSFNSNSNRKLFSTLNFNFKTSEKITVSDPVNESKSNAKLIYEENKNKKNKNIIQKSPQLPRYSCSSSLP